MMMFIRIIIPPILISIDSNLYNKFFKKEDTR